MQWTGRSYCGKKENTRMEPKAPGSGGTTVDAGRNVSIFVPCMSPPRYGLFHPRKLASSNSSGAVPVRKDRAATGTAARSLSLVRVGFDPVQFFKQLVVAAPGGIQNLGDFGQPARILK